MMNGVVLQTPGPLIPFLAAQARIPATSYFFVFISRSIGSLIGAIIYKCLEKKGLVANHNKVLGITSIVFFFSLIGFEFWHSLVGTGVLIGIYGGMYFVQNLALSISLTLIPSKEKLYLWVAVSNACFGIGSLLAPFIVDVFVIHAFTF